MCDLSIRECVSELDMCPCCRYAMPVGSVISVRGLCWSPLSCVFPHGSLPRWLATVAAIPVYPVTGAYASSGAYREREGRCALPRPRLRAEGDCTPVLRPSRIGEWGFTSERWGRSVDMRKLIGMTLSPPERAGPCFFEAVACWCVRGAHPVRKPVCRELGLVVRHIQVTFK